MQAFDVQFQAVGFSVERVLITRLVGSTYYARIVLLGPAGERRSVDARPSDSIALALQAKSPVYVGTCAVFLEPRIFHLWF